MPIRVLRGVVEPVPPPQKGISVTWKRWLVSGLNALLSGAFATVGSIAAGITLKQGLIVVGGCAVGSFAKWYAQHPLPGAES